MRVAGFTEPGGPEVLTILDVPEPEAGPGEVRVRVRTAGVQPFDLAVREGWSPPGTPEGFPRVPGNEFAGVVDQVGAGVTGVAPGDEVIGYCRLDAYAEYVVVPEEALTAKPASMPWDVAGGFPAAVMTPHIALEEMAVGAGDTLLVHAAAGAVGTVAVQLARIAGATVIGTASEGNHEYLRSLGVVPVAYGDGLEERIRA
ncbi:MAG: NADP-dependent oxidoreductase, partial [Spirillospora sp.]